MRIAGVVRIWPTHRGVGGMQGHALNLYEGLAARGHDVEVFTTRHPTLPEEVIEKGVKIHYLAGCKPAVYTDAYFRLVKQKFKERHEKRAFNVIHSESQAGKSLLLEGVSLVATWHGMGFCNYRNKVNEAFLRNKTSVIVDSLHKAFRDIVREVFDFQKIHYHIAISDQAYEDLLTIYKIPKERLFRVFNGFKTSLFKKDPKARLEIRKRYKIPENAFVVGCGGRLTPEKGHASIIQVIPDFLQKYPEAYFLVLGSGPFATGYQRLHDKRVLLSGTLPYEQMGLHYNAMDVFVDPIHHYSGLDMTIQEAMLCGVPIIATDTGSIKKSLLPSEDYGYTFSLGNIEQFKKLLYKIRNQDTKMMGDAAQKFASKFCSLEKMCEGVEKVFKYALEKGLNQ